MSTIKQAFNVKNLFLTITKLAKSETTSKALLGELSRSILELHSGDSDQRHDVRPVNKLLSVLSPVNARATRLFLVNFLPYVFDQETNTFGKMTKKTAIQEAKQAAMVEFLADPANNIWTWQKDNVSMEAKPVDYVSKIETLVGKALDPEKGAVHQLDVLRAVFKAGVTIDAIIGLLSELDQVTLVESDAA